MAATPVVRGLMMMRPGRIMYGRVWLNDELCMDRLFHLRRFLKIRVGHHDEAWLPIYGE